jgi:Uncharacterised nucleotidyltransferase
MGMSTGRSPDLVVGLPATLRILLAAARSGTPSLDQIEMTRSDWDNLPAAARRHGLNGLLQATLSHSTAPPEVREQGRAVAHQTALAGLRGMAEVIEICRLLRDAGVGAVCLKGPTLAHWLYGTVGFRRFADLDVMVAPRDVTAAYRALAPHGYRLPERMSVRTAQAIYRGLGAWPLTHTDRYPVDLHFRLCHVSFGSPLTPEMVIGESRELDGMPGVRVPSATHTALMLLVHASKHLWCTLEMLLAIARVVEQEDVDWLRVERLARRSGTFTGCAAGLVLASELFGAKIPTSMRLAGKPRARDDLRHAARAALLKPTGVFADRREEWRVHRATFDGLRGRLRYDLCRVLSPTPLEREWYELPDPMASLYVPLRMIRLTMNAGRGRMSR